MNDVDANVARASKYCLIFKMLSAVPHVIMHYIRHDAQYKRSPNYLRYGFELEATD